MGKVRLVSWWNSSPADAVANPFPSHTTSVFSHSSQHLPFPPRLLLSSSPQDSVLSPFCFNSSLITSHVPHQVLISSLLPDLHAHAHTVAEECTCARPKPQILMLPTLVCQRAHAYLKRLLRGYVLSFKHVSLERKYLHPETLIITHAHKRRIRWQIT